MFTLGEDEELYDVAEKLLRTYTLGELLELSELEEIEAVYRLLMDGLIDPDLIVEL